MATKSDVSELDLSTRSSEALEEMLFESEARPAFKINWYLVGSGALLAGNFLYLLSEIGILGSGFMSDLGRTVPFAAIFFMTIATVKALRPKRTRRSRVFSSRPLVRPRKRRWLFGVCRGLAERFGVPVGLLRLLYLTIIPFFGLAIGSFGMFVLAILGIASYVILALAIPGEQTNRDSTF